MSFHRNRTPRMAALFLGATLGAASLTMVPVAAQAASAPHASVSVASKAVTPATVVTRLSSAKGVAGDTVLVKGTGLATRPSSTWLAKAVTFGETTVASNKVTALSATALLVEVPAGANGVVTVLVGDATKGPKFTYAAPATITTDQDDLDVLDPVSETGLADVAIDGTNFTKATKVVVGGKPAKINKEGGFTATKLTVAFPAGLVGEQDVVVVDGGKNYFVGFVTYYGKPVSMTGFTGTSYVEQPSAIELTGTNLDLVASVTYDGAKASFKKPAKGVTDKLTVTVPKGEAVEDGDLVLSTKYGATDTLELDRVTAPTPVVTAVSTVTPATAGEVTLTGTGLTGLKKVVIKNAAGKAFNGSKISVVSSTSAKVTLPALVAGTYKMTVTAISATSSAELTVTVGSSTPSTPAPTVSGVTSTDGEAVTIAGTNLTGATAVSITGTDAPGTISSGLTVNGGGTQITLTLDDALAAGSYQVTVTTPGGTSTAATLTVTAAEEPVVVTLDSADYDADTRVITVSGENVESATKIRYYVTSAGVGTAVVDDLVAGQTGYASLTLDVAGALADGDYTVQVSVDGTDWSDSTTIIVGA